MSPEHLESIKARVRAAESSPPGSAVRLELMGAVFEDIPALLKEITRLQELADAGNTRVKALQRKIDDLEAEIDWNSFERYTMEGWC